MAKQQILFIHSAGKQGPDPEDGSAEFLKFLEESLGSDYELRHPLMPHPDAPDPAAWEKELTRQFNDLGENPILIGHSLGSSTILKFLSDHKIVKEIAGVFLVETPYWTPNKDWDASGFILRENYTSYLPHTKYFFYRSRDGKEIPLAQFERYTKEMPHATARQVDAGGHQVKKGLPELVEDIKSLSK